MTNQSDPATQNFGSFMGLGSLLIVAGVLSYGIHSLYSEWPVGFDGWVGVLFLVTGDVFVGLSLLNRIRVRRAAGENANPRL